MKKPFMLKSTSFIAMLLLSQVAMAKAVGTVTFAAGDVTIAHADKTVTNATKNAELNAGDAIETKEGRVQLSMIDGGKISLQPNTIYKINQFEFTGKEDGSEFNFTELVKGGLRTVSGLIGHKNRDHYQLKTAVATIGIRGTEFTVNFNDNNLLMTTNHGSVDVCNLGGCLNAITGQTIEVAGIGGAPKPSNKAAKAAAAPPAGGKAVFAAGESINVAALTTTLPTPTPSPAAGNDTIVSLATLLSGVNNNGVYSGTASFKGNSGNGNPNAGNLPNGNALKQFTDSTASTNIVTGTTLAASNDGIVRWGSSAGGTLNGQNVLISSWITGIATPTTGLTNLVGTYNVFGSSAPFLVSGGSVSTLGASNSILNTSSLTFNFVTNTFGYNINVPTTINGTFNLAGSGGLSPAGNFISTGIVTNATACVIACTGVFTGGNLVQGAFFGVNGERAGLQYGINAPSLNGQVYGNAVLK